MTGLDSPGIERVMILSSDAGLDSCSLGADDVDGTANVDVHKVHVYMVFN